MQKKDDTRSSEILDLIREGKLRPYNISTFLTNEETKTYASVLKVGFMYYEKDFLAEPPKLETYFFYGYPEYQKQYAEETLANQGYKPEEIFETGKSNTDMFNAYKGQPAAILSNFTPQAVRNDLPTFMGVFDNYHRKPFPARNNNKTIYGERIILISPYSPEEFYKKFKGVEREDPFAFYRRITAFYHFKEDGLIELSQAVGESGAFQRKVLLVLRNPFHPCKEDEKS